MRNLPLIVTATFLGIITVLVFVRYLNTGTFDSTVSSFLSVLWAGWYAAWANRPKKGGDKDEPDDAA